MNHTSNYNLSQWDAEDKVLRTDFNADNAKIDAALAGLEKRVALLDRAVPNLAYYVGQLVLLDFENRKKFFPAYSMTYYNFYEHSTEALTGNVVFRDGQLVLNGAGEKATVSTSNFSIHQAGWTVARLWTHSKGGTLTAALNGEEMLLCQRQFSSMYNERYVLEQCFIVENAGKTSAKITLNLDCGTDPSMIVKDYCLMVF